MTHTAWIESHAWIGSYLGLVALLQEDLVSPLLGSLLRYDSSSMASAKEDVFFSNAPLTPEEEVGEALPAPVSMEEEEWV